jgi:nucleoside-diphosphate-sugar epimerase
LRALVEQVSAFSELDMEQVRFGARPYREGEPHHLAMSNQRAADAFGWSPTITFERALGALDAL